MHRIALLLLFLGVVTLPRLSASPDAVAATEEPGPDTVLEITCGHDVVRADRTRVVARPDGVLVRFTYLSGAWMMGWRNHLELRSPPGTRAVEAVWPIPPGMARVLCHPADRDWHGDPEGLAPWGVDVMVADPDDHFTEPAMGCTHGVGTSWHGRAVSPQQERQIVWEAVGQVGVREQPGDRLVRLAYPEGPHHHWGVLRDGKVIAQSDMLDDGGRVRPNSITACSPLPQEPSTS